MLKNQSFTFFTQGLLTPNQEEAVKNCIEKLNKLLLCATKKRPEGPPSVISGTDILTEDKTKLKEFFAEALAKQLIQRNMKEITTYELHKLVFAIAQKTILDDGTLVAPPQFPPLPSPPLRPQEYFGAGSAGGYSTTAFNQAGPSM